MTTTIATENTTPHDVIAGAEADTTAGADTTAQHHPHRWGLRRAGMTNVWFYYDNEFDISGGRLLIRGTNGSGKSRALEMLLPFLLDAERRKIDATGSNKVTLPELMKAGSLGVANRVGYLWIELERTLDDTNVLDAVRIQDGLTREWLTIGAHVKYSRSTNNVEVSYFTTPLRVGHDLHLMTGNEPLSRDRLIEMVGSDQVTDQAGHRSVIRAQVFGLGGEGGEERYKGLLQLLHTLRQPDVGNRIEEGRLAQILSDALPPLSDSSISAAGEQLDTLSETRQAQERLEDGLTHVTTFLDTYQRYTAARIAERAAEAVTAARAVTAADRDAAKKRDEHQRLGAEREETRLAISELEGKIDGLDGTIAGIKALDIYKAIEQLDSRRATVAALGRTAEAALKTAADTRVREGRAAINADKVALEVVRKAKYADTVLAKLRSAVEQAQMPHGVLGALPAAIEAQMVAQPPSRSTIRLCLDTPPETLETPTPAILTVTPPNLDELTRAVSAINNATTKRARLAQGRAEKARRVGELKADADDAEQKATDTEIHRDDVAKIADELQESLARSVAAYTDAWQTWIKGDAVLAAYEAAAHAQEGFPTASEAMSELHARIAGTDLYEIDDQGLAALDKMAEAAAARAKASHNRRLGVLESHDRTQETEEAQLLEEQAVLEDEQDPAPPMPPWATHATGMPLWRAVDFTEELDSDQRAGLEGALLASGLLTAEITPEGDLTSQDGVTFVAVHGPEVKDSLRRYLRAAASDDVDGAAVDAILARITAGPAETSTAQQSSHPIRVDVDGSWANGPLHGLHRRDRARHIGAAARATARTERLNQIANQLAAFEQLTKHRADERNAIQGHLAALDDAVAMAPTTQPIATGRVLLDKAAEELTTADNDLAAAQKESRTARTAWTSAADDHTRICEDLSLPTSADALGNVARACELTTTGCEQLTQALSAAKDTLTGHEERLDELAALQDEVAAGEAAVEQRWGEWHRDSNELASIETNIGADADQVQRDLATAQGERKRAEGDLKRRRDSHTNLVSEETAAGKDADAAEQTSADARENLLSATTALQARMTLPGLADAAFAETPINVADLSPDPREVTEAAKKLTASLRSHEAQSDENALLAAHKRLAQELSSSFDITVQRIDDVQLFTLTDADGSRSVAHAAADLATRVELGHQALTAQEVAVFTDFILGGVADELADRISQAEDLVEAMRASLATIQTSNNIAVTLRWALDADTDTSTRRIVELIATAAQLRPTEQTTELTELLRARVEEFFAADPSVGYATHLAAALDYRSWFRMKVIILGPEPKQTREVGPRAKLSQGETRFVSYVTLFAAVNAYLSGLPDGERALRLLLIDDAFAKVDDRTIGELMGLLVRLDIDFVMTAHGLWGNYRQVPRLDAYEIRRNGEEGPAVAVHTHWDGKTRHLRAAR